jgi:hypothetical protein
MGEKSLELTSNQAKIALKWGDSTSQAARAVEKAPSAQQEGCGQLVFPQPVKGAAVKPMPGVHQQPEITTVIMEVL